MNAQGSDEWKQERAGHLTASRMADVLATLKSGGEPASRRNLRTRLAVERLTGAPMEDGFQSKAMLDGIENERLAVVAYECRAQELVEGVGFVRHPTIDWYGASPDGLIGEDGLLEVKCPIPATHVEYLMAGTAPRDYLPQMMAQMSCTGRKWVDFVSYCPLMPEKLRLFVVRLERDDAEIARIEAEAVKFLAEVEEMTERLRRRAA